jgi:hypothetical protein
MNTLTPEQLHALKDFSAKYGRCWKSHLSNAWMYGLYYSSLDSARLQQVRNQFGPSWLVKFQFNKPSTHVSRD